MPIQITDFPDPLSASALASSIEPMLIKSKAYYQLLHELRRYCGSQTCGRSFLIAGHRGSGKTTLVLSAFEKILREAEVEQVKLRPLMVPLLGPSLLPDPNEKDLAEPGKGAASGEKKLTEFENVLVQITLALYRAVVREFTRAYEERMVSSAFPPWRSDSELTKSLLEAPGQLILELDEYPGKARLREFWRRANALSDGVLPHRRIATQKWAVSNQGVRELVALCSVSEAYRRISGTIQAKTEDKAGAQDSATKTRDVDLKGKELFGPLITLLTGGAVATGVATLNPNNPNKIGIAAVAGILTALASAVVGKYSTSRSHQRSASKEDLFLPDLSVATLDRVLPVLLERVRDAGLAPVFVIDELDKVSDLSDRIPQMVKRLKKLVAESAFFCFLTDRRYFEELRTRNIGTPYSVEYTYFTNYVFVTFRHTDLHLYLSELLKKPEVTAPPEISGGTVELNEEAADYAVLPYVLLHAAQMHPIDLRRQLAEIRGPDGAVALPIGSVRSIPSRRLELLVQVAIELLLEEEPMEWELASDPAFRRLAHDALYFISRQWESGANELKFGPEGRKVFEKYLTDRMRTEQPEKKPVATDATKPSNESSPTAEKIAQSSEAAKEESSKAVQGQSNEPVKGQSSEASKGQSSNAVEGQDQALAPPRAPTNGDKSTAPFMKDNDWRPSYTKDQADFLWDYVERLGKLLEDPITVRTMALTKSGRFSAQVLNALNLADLGPLLEVQPGSAPQVFRWRYSRAGRGHVSLVVPKSTEEIQGQETLPGIAPVVSKPFSTTIAEIDLIEGFNATLSKMTKGTVNCGVLATGFGVISTSPAWPSVEAAMKRLKSDTGEYPQKNDDVAIVGQFADLLRRSAETIALGILSAWAVGAWQQNRSANRISFGLQIVSQALRLKTLHEELVAQRIKKFGDEVSLRLNVNENRPFLLSEAASVKRWRAYVTLRMRQVGQHPEKKFPIDKTIEGIAWNFWMSGWQKPETVPNFEAVICAAARQGPSRFLTFPPEEMSARSWSVALYAALIEQSALQTQADLPGSPPQLPTASVVTTPSIPTWLAVYALQQLGFSDQIMSLSSLGRVLSKIFDAAQWLLRAAAPAVVKEGRDTMIIVSKAGVDSEIWKPGKECAALVLRQPELIDLDKLWQNNQETLLRWLKLKWLVFDWSGWQLASKRKSRQQAGQLSLDSRQELEAARLLVRFFFPNSSSELGTPAIVPPDWQDELPPPFFAVPVPASIDELFAIISRRGRWQAPS
jgi:hypothetical protein